MRIATVLAVAMLGSMSFAGGEHAQAAVQHYHLNIPRQPLDTALKDLAQQTGLQIGRFSGRIDGSAMVGPVKGDQTPEQALKTLLGSTGLNYKIVSDTVIAVYDPKDTTLSELEGARNKGKSEDSKGGTAPSGSPLQLAQANQGSNQTNAPVNSFPISQSASPAPRENARRADEAPKLEEIVVTAQKRSENLQGVPVSVQVISGDYIAEQNQNSLSDLTRTVPAVHIATGYTSNSLSMRGIGTGQEGNAGFDQAVGIFADDIYRGRSRMTSATFLDLDRIEFLKGPQSIFFGNNAIAGALNIVSKKPGDTFGGYVRVLGGMFEQYALEGAVGGPVTDTLGVRLAATADGNERGWLKDVNSGDHIPRIHNLAGRLTLVYKPTEALDATLKLEGSHHKTEGAPFDQPLQSVDCPPSPPFPIGFFDSYGQCATDVAQHLPVGFDTNLVAPLRGEQNQISNDEGVLTLNYRRWNHTFTSVTGYSYYDFNGSSNEGELPTPVISSETPEHYHQFSQELRVASPTGQPIEYVAGAYFQTDRLVSDFVVDLPFLTPVFQGDPTLASYLPISLREGVLQSERIDSVFGSLTWNATDRLKLNAGLRGSRVDKDHSANIAWGTSTQVFGGFVPDPLSGQQLVGSLIGIPSLGTSPPVTQSSHALMPSARIQYQFNPDVMGYFRYDRGFLAGGFNGTNIINFSHITQFGPEHVNAYEVGLKSKWLNDTVLLNLDLFLADYTDLQVVTGIYGCFGAAGCGYRPDIGNAAKSRSQGVELEGDWLPAKDLRLGANVTFLKAYYLSYPNSPLNTTQNYCSLPNDAVNFGGAGTPYCLAQFPAGVPPVYNLSGQATAYAPKWSGNLTAAYGVNLPGDFKLTTELNPYFTTSYYTSSGDPIFQNSGYVRLDGRLSFAPQDARWSLDLIGKNLTDRTIVTWRRYLYGFSKEQPRNVALQFRYHF